MKHKKFFNFFDTKQKLSHLDYYERLFKFDYEKAQRGVMRFNPAIKIFENSEIYANHYDEKYPLKCKGLLYLPYSEMCQYFSFLVVMNGYISSVDKNYRKESIGYVNRYVMSMFSNKLGKQMVLIQLLNMKSLVFGYPSWMVFIDPNDYIEVPDGRTEKKKNKENFVKIRETQGSIYREVYLETLIEIHNKYDLLTLNHGDARLIYDLPYFLDKSGNYVGSLLDASYQWASIKDSKNNDIVVVNMHA